MHLSRRQFKKQDTKTLSLAESSQQLGELRAQHKALMAQHEELRRAQKVLETSRAQYFDLYNHAPVGYFTLNKQGLILEANLTAATMLGMAREALIMQPLLSSIIPEDQELYRSHHQKLFASGSPQACELRMVKQDGTTFWARVDTTVAQDVACDEPVNRVTMSDITARKLTEIALQESEWRNKTISESITDYVFVVDVEASGRLKLRFASDSMLRLTGRTVDEAATPDMWKSIIHPDDVQRFFGFIKHTLVTAQAGAFECRTFTKQGKERWVRVYAKPQVGEGKVVRTIVGAVQDITERKMAENQMEKSRQQLRALLAKMHHLREEEQIRISREVHDVLGQQITAFKMDLTWFKQRLPKITNEVLRNQFQEKLEDALSATMDMMQSVRTISRRLRPSMLDDLGLEAAVLAEAQGFQERSGIVCKVMVPAKALSLESEQATGIFRIFQEILTNVARHAQATRVGITLGQRGGELTLKVSDNGCGIREQDLADPKSLGLLSMTERASLLQGRIEIRRGKQRGTTVLLSIPTASAKDMAA